MLDILTTKKIKEIKEKHEGRIMDNYLCPTIFFDDDHYRSSLDKSPLKYPNLYDWLLLPKSKFDSCLNYTEKRNLGKFIKENNIPAAHELALTKVEDIMKDTGFEKNFVIRRIKEILLSYVI
jgi:hypothetical protein